MTSSVHKLRLNTRRVSIGTSDPAQEFAHLRRTSNPLSFTALLKTKLADSLSEISSQFNLKTQLPLVSLNEDWTSIHDLVLAIFHHEKVHPSQVCSVRERIRLMLQTDIGSFIPDYYTTRLLPQGIMEILSPLEHLTGSEFIDKLSQTWNDFYTKVLPSVDSLFYDVKPKDCTIRSITLIQFRDGLLKMPQFEEYVKQNASDNQFCSAIRQMVLVLQSIHDVSPTNDKALKLEFLTSCIISPYIGHLGLYEQPGQPPTVKANNLIRQKVHDFDKHSRATGPVDMTSSTNSLPYSTSSPKPSNKKRFLLPKRQLSSGTLAPVLEQLPFSSSHIKKQHHYSSVSSDSDEALHIVVPPNGASVRRRHSLQSAGALLGKLIS